MKFLFIILFPFVACTQQKVPYSKGTLNRSTPLLIIITGESNSGGRALNSDAYPNERGVRSGTKILNNWTLEFEDLNIGVNNMIGHYGLEDLWYTAHGFELQIANMVRDGALPNPTYIVKCGQGATHIADWADAGDYDGKSIYDTLTKRVDAAIEEIEDIESQSPQVYMFYSQGINDIPGGDPEGWKTATMNHFSRMRTRYGDFPIFMTQFNMPGSTSFNDDIQQICGLTPLVYSVNADGASNDGVYHWDYEGMKVISRRLICKLRCNF